MKKVIKIMFYIFISFLIIYNVTLTIQKIVVPNEVPSFFGYKNFVILSGSMENTLNIGDIIFVKERNDIKENDIISFKERSSIITHRIIKIIENDEGTFYRTKGDANEAIDAELISKDEIEGVYCFKIPKIGAIIMFLQSGVGIFLFLIIFLIIYILTNIKKGKGKHSK